MMIKKFTPLNKRVLVKLLEAETKTDAGIYLPDDAKTESKLGEVVAVSGEKPIVKVGDLVMYSSFSTNNIEIGGKEHVVLQESELLGKVE